MYIHTYRYPHRRSSSRALRPNGTISAFLQRRGGTLEYSQGCSEYSTACGNSLRQVLQGYSRGTLRGTPMGTHRGILRGTFRGTATGAPRLRSGVLQRNSVGPGVPRVLTGGAPSTHSGVLRVLTAGTPSTHPPRLAGRLRVRRRPHHLPRDARAAARRAELQAKVGEYSEYPVSTQSTPVSTQGTP